MFSMADNAAENTNGVMPKILLVDDENQFRAALKQPVSYTHLRAHET